MALGAPEILLLVLLVLMAAVLVAVLYLIAKYLGAIGGKTCPHCAERIKGAARVCRHCHRDVTGV